MQHGEYNDSGGDGVKLKLAGVQNNSVVDGPGLRTVIFTQGCPHHCPGCHNPQTLDPAGGRWEDVSDLMADICADTGVRGVTFSGGEPFAQARALAQLAAGLKTRKMHIMVYSGYTFEELQRKAISDSAVAALLSLTDLLIDGPFILAQRDLSLLYRGSHNQRIIDVQATLEEGRVILSPLHFRGQEQAYA
ncbi:anaerobic ribonucleoside-triphosphate reductase activating protein [Dethiobacter alkaliphilus]|uniref:Anaerobic ribonucleoside-triphosphate reductase-activating protein n=1 Tax=Dethiobacter alkaliphilus AHT 1 TaxID=555088 RepID=C0GFR9_DETAL|nr:anaerobic ribonucleoside-triphosphate reductase activating protein [Dethiobacter alkaliphilus]EEG77608.1 anaerobic ribonucleoside-triphosphate reductase activating protein [Dethiobacter alkaliphilus AHT 1]